MRETTNAVLYCPICKKHLKSGKSSSYCPSLHGQMLDASKLYEINKHEFTATDVSHYHDSIDCPSCGAVMTSVDYRGMGVHIDSCRSCGGKWLDGGEIDRIQSHEIKLTSEQEMFIAGLTINAPAKSLLPEPGGLGYARDVHGASSLIRAVRFLKSPSLPSARMSGSAGPIVAASGIMGIIKMLLHSWFSRILILIIAVITAVIYYLVYVEF